VKHKLAVLLSSFPFFDRPGRLLAAALAALFLSGCQGIEPWSGNNSGIATARSGQACVNGKAWGLQDGDWVVKEDCQSQGLVCVMDPREGARCQASEDPRAGIEHDADSSGSEPTGNEESSSRHGEPDADLDREEHSAPDDEHEVETNRPEDEEGPRGRIIQLEDGGHVVFVCTDGRVQRRAEFDGNYEIREPWCEIPLGLRLWTDYHRQNELLFYDSPFTAPGNFLGCDQCPEPGAAWCEFERTKKQIRYYWDHLGRYAGRDYSFYPAVDGDTCLTMYHYDEHGRARSMSDAAQRHDHHGGGGSSISTRDWFYDPEGTIRIVDGTHSSRSLTSGTVEVWHDDYYYDADGNFALAVRQMTVTDWRSGQEDQVSSRVEVVDEPDPPPDLSNRHLDWYCAEIVPEEFLR